MKQKPRKSTNGFHPSAGNQTDPEEMCGDGARDGMETDSADTVSRLSQLLATSSCDNPKLFTTGDTLSQLRDEISSEHRHLTSLYTSIDNVTIYRVAHWSREKIEAELAQYKELLAEMDTHEEIIKLLNNICVSLHNADEDDEDDEDTPPLPTDDIKQIQTILYKLWLRLLEWECLLEQQQLGHLQQMEMLTDSNDEGEELLRSAPAENVTEELVASHCPGVTHRPSGPRPAHPTLERKPTITTAAINNDELFIILHKSSSKRGEDLDDSGATCDTSGSDQHYGDNDQNVNNVMGDHCVAAGPNTVHHYPDQPMSLSHQSLRQSHSSYTPSSTPSSSSSSSHDRSCDGKLDHSDSDSGVSDLSSDLTFYNGININTFTPSNYSPREKEVSKPTIDHMTKKSKFNKKFQDFPHSRRSILKMQENFYHGILYWVKLILLVMLIFFLILTVFIVSHVKCFNDICAISLETKINYHKYASPI